MPEIIEVRTYADFIEDKVKGKILNDIVIKNGRYFKKGPFAGFKELLKDLPLKVKEVNSKGKFMYMILTDDICLGFTLGLSGGWFFQPKGKKTLIHGLGQKFDSNEKYSLDNQELYSGYMEKSLKHINVEFEFASGSLKFYDTLSYGTIKIFTPSELEKKLKSLGTDIMDPDYKFSEFYNHIMIRRNLNKPIGNVLVDQKTISGVGNYLRADCLWMSKISPFHKMKDLSEAQLQTIFHNIRVLIWGEYDRKQGEKLKIITKKDKTPIDYKRDFFVYKEVTDVYGNPVIQEPLYEGSQKRFIYWVKQVQK